ncbi:hypothetical protein SLEP1_g29710 [Rubroshorea leprosula]|uniref:Disease resistance protein RGA3 n=1 Tax=Rubroshorea leprosula TaxID=152421 RepID=A0AAV5JXT3_9ROSI|nr:hypothetical protein SLEP1_g29710 [Rubroshorea leprosula]
MADAIVSFVLDQLTTTIVDKASEEVELLVDVEKEVTKLETNLRLIDTFLRDAEEKKRTDGLVKEWLDRLKEASYDMGDALDEWRTTVEIEALEAQNAASLKKALCNFISCFSIRRAYTHRKIALNIKEINQRLDDIVKKKEMYQLQLMSMPISNTINHLQQRPETSSLVDVSKLCGRDKEKADILNYLWGGSGENEAGELIPTISIVGMGGLGKTALAQLICNDDNVKKHFDRVIWVCVSDLFYEKKVARAIIQGLEKLTHGAAYGLESDPLQFLLERISRSIQGMKYFLVLDDVWDGNKGERWEGLKTTFKLGAPGSRILVTTRDVEVAKMMGSSSSQIISLEKLGDEQCWSIIKHLALEGRDNQNLEKIGREIAKKCKGLPLAAKTLGSHLKSKRIKQCFMYCALFHKDYEINRWVVIAQWMAMGYLGSDGNADLESKGNEYFHILVERSFFQDIEMFEGEIACCKMHDIVHDFARYLGENEFATKEINSDHSTIDGSKNRHLTVMIDEGIPFPTSISGAEKLRALRTFTGKDALTYEALGSLFNHCRRLRVLILGWPDGTDHFCKEIPEGIGKLIHLRLLYLRDGRKLESLPEALCNLLNLEFLDLLGCTNLKQLPDSIGKLINLRHLCTAGCSALTQYPEGLQKLTSLRYLSGLIARADRNNAKEFCLADLGNLKHLHELALKVVGNSIDMEQARKAQLQDIQWLSIFLAGSIQRADIIEALDPHRNIPNLGFYGNYWFSWGAVQLPDE